LLEAIVLKCLIEEFSKFRMKYIAYVVSDLRKFDFTASLGNRCKELVK